MANSRFLSARGFRMLVMVGGLLVAAVGLAVVPDRCAAADTELSEIERLSLEQSRIADNYSRLEQTIIRMAEIEASTNPQRAALLKRAVQQSSERLTRTQLNAVAKLLAPPAQLKRAIDDQELALKDLKDLLELLLSEDRSERRKDERDQIREYIKEVVRLIRLQRGLEGRTQNADDPQKLAGDQDRVAERTGELAKKIKDGEPKDGEPKDGEPKDGEPKDGEPKDGKPKDGEPKDGKPKDGEPKDGEPKDGEPNDGEPKDGEPKDGKPKDGEPKDGKPKDGEPKDGEPKDGEPKDGEPKDGEPKDGEPKDGKPKDGKPKDGKPMDGEPMDGEPMDGEPMDGESESGQGQSPPPPPANENPARKRIKAAEERMRKAKQKLEEAKRDDAVKEQEEARHELEKAKEELEEILRQLREEEIEHALAMLEGRFRRMLEAQLKIYEATKHLDKIAVDERDRQVDIQASKLGFDESKLVVDADKALLLLVEEGSSVAFPETVQQMRDEMQSVSDRLAAVKVGLITQTAEEEIIASLEDMIAALQKAQQDLAEQKQNPQQPPMPVNPDDMPLVDEIAELKMIRGLQIRINTRTKRYARLLEDIDDPVGAATDADLRRELLKLGERQDRIYRVTRDIEIGKNR